MFQKKPAPDVIEIRNLEVESRIGVPDEERLAPQRLAISLVIQPNLAFTAMDDRIDQTVDYAAVCESVKATAARRPRRLIETLAEEIATDLLGAYPIWRLTVEIRKFILPETEYVAVRIERPSL